jgi:hypothetical protein
MQVMDETKPPEVASEAQKPCIACRELIPIGATVCSHCHQSQVPEKSRSFKKITGWVAGITAVIGLFASLSGGVQWIKNHWNQRSDIRAELAVAESQTQRAEYEAAVATYQDILKKDSRNQQAADEQVTAAMRWAENFQVLIPEGKNPTDAAAPKLDAILPILDAGLARAKGQRAADILAHIGWVHWLNWHIAEREIGPAAEQSFLQALKIDPSNMYANAMFGNWLLQNNRGQSGIRNCNRSSETTRSGGHDTKHGHAAGWQQHLVELTCKRIGGPGRDRTDDLFHAIQHNSNRIMDIARNQGSEKALWEHFSRSRCALKCARVRAGWESAVERQTSGTAGET